MLGPKNNFRNSKKGDILCPKCHREIENEQHLFQ